MQMPGDVAVQKQLTDLRVQQWLKDELFSPHWWVLMTIISVLIIIWLVLVRKSKLMEICLFVFLSAVLFMGINEYGEELTLWDYPTDIIAWFPPLSSVNFLLLILGFSIIYQYFEAIGMFAAVSAVFAASVCFIAEPLMAAGGLHKLIGWHYFESLPVYFLAALTTKSAVRLIFRKAEARKRYKRSVKSNA